MKNAPILLRWLAGLVICLALLVLPLPAGASSTILLVNGDGPDEGLNDPTPFDPEGGNPALTLGNARARAVEFAAGLWSSNLSSEVPIRVLVSFNPMGGTDVAAILGIGGPESVFRDFAGTPLPGVWYPSALADSLAGFDLDPSAVDATLVINSDVDGTAMGSSRFYYGFDDAPPPGDIDLVKVALHELAHGFGFTTFLDLTTGGKLFGFDDAFMLHLEQHGASPADFPSMTDVERTVAFEAGPDLHWTGPSTVSAASGLLAGTDASGHVEMYGPSPLEPGASLSHFATTLDPDNVMEPSYVTTEVDFVLLVSLFEDLGWSTSSVCTDLPLGQ